MTSQPAAIPVRLASIAEPRWRRRWVVGAAAAVVVVVALVAVLVWVRSAEDGPEDVVRHYLNAIRAGDVDRALRIAGDPSPDGEVDDTFLVAEATVGDWEIAQVIRRYPGQDADPLPVIVDVTLRTPDGTTGQGRFQLIEDGGDWSIENPFGRVGVWPAPADFVELNDAARPIPEGDPVTYLLFPGAYRRYSSLEDMVVVEPPAIVLPADIPQSLAPGFALTEAGEAAAHRAVNAYLDDCAASTELAPAGCAFAAGDYSYAELEDDYYDEPEDLAWEVITYPEVLLVSEGAGYGVVDRHAGAVRFTGTGIPFDSDDDDEDDRRSFEAECRIDLSQLTLTLTSAAAFEVSGGDGSLGTWPGVPGTCRQ
jgi:hypothetical protein